MTQIATDNEAQVSVQFKFLPTINKIESKKQGRPIYDDAEVCEIRFAGNKQTVGVFPALDFAPGYSTDPETEERTRQTYAQKYNEQYLAFRRGDAQAQSGTPLEALPFLKPGKIKELKALNIHTAEALAGIDGPNLKMLGMGGRDLKSKAAEYLENATGPAAAAIQEEALREQRDRIAELEAEITAMRAGAAPEAAAPGPFDQFSDEDLANWLADNGVSVDKRWRRKTLLERAERKNADLTKQVEAA